MKMNKRESRSCGALHAVMLALCWAAVLSGPAGAQNQEQEFTAMEKAYNAAVDLINDGKTEAARTALNAVLQMPVTGDAGRARQVQSACWNNLGMLDMLQGNLVRGGNAFRKAIELDEDNAMALNNLGSVYVKQGRYEEAQKHYAAAIGADPYNTEAFNNLARLQIAARQYKSAARLLLAALELDSQNERTLELLALVYQRADRPVEAETLRRSRMQAAAGEPGKQADIARRYLQAGDVGQARAVIAQIRDATPDWKGLAVLEGQLAAASRDWATAEKSLSAALAQDPKDVIARNDLVTVLLRSGKTGDALRVATEGTQATPDLSAAWYLLGLAHEAGRNSAGAETAYRRAVGVDAGHARAWRNLGVLAAAKNQGDEAVVCFEKALQADPFDRDNLFNLGYALTIRRKDDYERGVRMLGRVALSTNDAVGQKALDFINKLHAAVSSGTDAAR